MLNYLGATDETLMGGCISHSRIIVHTNFDGFEFLVGERFPFLLEEEWHLHLSCLVAKSSLPQPRMVFCWPLQWFGPVCTQQQSITTHIESFKSFPRCCSQQDQSSCWNVLTNHLPSSVMSAHIGFFSIQVAYSPAIRQHASLGLVHSLLA